MQYVINVKPEVLSSAYFSVELQLNVGCLNVDPPNLDTVLVGSDLAPEMLMLMAMVLACTAAITACIAACAMVCVIFFRQVTILLYFIAIFPETAL